MFQIVAKMGCIWSTLYFPYGLLYFQMYLMKYGYMDMDHQHHGKSANLLSKDGLKKYILEFQKFAHINQVKILQNNSRFQSYKAPTSVTYVHGVIIISNWLVSMTLES